MVIAIRNIGDPRTQIRFFQSLVIAAAVLINREHFIVG